MTSTTAEDSPQTHLFTGPTSLRLYLAQSLVSSLDGLGEASLRKCNDAEEWVQHMADMHMPTVPSMDWKRLKVHVREGQARLQVLPDLSKELSPQEMVLLFRMQAMAPLPRGGIQGVCALNGLTLYMHDVQEFEGIKVAIKANLAAMRAVITEFKPVFCHILRAEIETRLGQHRYDVQLRDDFVRLLGATEARGYGGALNIENDYLPYQDEHIEQD